jgi:hypothetical protein
MATIQRNRSSWASPSDAPADEIEMQSGSSQSNSEATNAAKAEQEKKFTKLVRKTFHYGELDRALERPHIAGEQQPFSSHYSTLSHDSARASFFLYIYWIRPS